MAQYLSEDLRIRVIGAIEGGMSRNGAARRFGVSIASAVRWMDEYLRCGRTAPKPRGGDRRSGRIEAQADLLMRAIEETPDITLMELREKLIAERGESFAISTLHAFYRRHEVTFKKGAYILNLTGGNPALASVGTNVTQRPMTGKTTLRRPHCN